MRRWWSLVVAVLVSFVAACGVETSVEPAQQLAQSVTPGIEATVIETVVPQITPVPTVLPGAPDFSVTLYKNAEVLVVQHH